MSQAAAASGVRVAGPHGVGLADAGAAARVAVNLQRPGGQLTGLTADSAEEQEDLYGRGAGGMLPPSLSPPPSQNLLNHSPDQETMDEQGSDPDFNIADYEASPRSGPRRRKQHGVPEYLASAQLQHNGGLAHEDPSRQAKRMRDVVEDHPGPRNRRSRVDDFRAHQYVGHIFMRVQGAKAPAPLVHFDDDIMDPRWFKETIDGVQPVMGSDDFDPEDVNLESMGKLVDGSVLPATLGEVAAYFTHVLGDPRTNREIAPRVLIAIQCDRAKGWFTYKRDNDNSNFVPVVLCAAENGRGGLEEVSPAHFEVHRAQCAQKKWRQSFKVLGAQKLHKVTSLAQAALGDVLRHLERILGAEKAPMLVMRTGDSNGPAVAVRMTAANHPSFRQPPMGSMDLMGEEGGVRIHSHNSVSRLATPTTVNMGPLHDNLSMSNGHVTHMNGQPVLQRLGSRMGSQIMGQPVGPLSYQNSGMPPRPLASPGMSPSPRAMGLVGARPMINGAQRQTQMGPRPGQPMSVIRRHTDDPSARSHLPPLAGIPDDLRSGAGPGLVPGVGLDMLANVGSGEVQQRGGAGINSPQGLQAVAAALQGVTFDELLQLVVDNSTRRQHQAQQMQLIAQLAQYTTKQAAADSVDLIVGGAGHGDGPAVVPNAALNKAEREAIGVIIKSVRGADVAHAVRGIMQHVAMSYVGEDPASAAAAPELATALLAAVREKNNAAVSSSPTAPPSASARAPLPAAATASGPTAPPSASARAPLPAAAIASGPTATVSAPPAPASATAGEGAPPDDQKVEIVAEGAGTVAAAVEGAVA